MLGIKIIWIITNTIAAAWFNYIFLFNPLFEFVLRVEHKWKSLTWEKMMFTLFGALATFYCAVAITLCIFASVGSAVITTSLVSFGLALMYFFLEQKFVDPYKRCIRVIKNPWFHPLVAFGCFVSSTFAIIFLADWRLAFIPIALWLLLGFLCAEIAIRRYMWSSKRDGFDCDRGMAIFAVNNAQGRRDFMAIFKNRYPFP